MTIGRPVTDAAGRARCLLSVAVITRDEEANLARCLDSVKTLVTDIVVVDSGSRDGTVAVAERFGARCVVAAWRGYAAQKNLALESCREPWVLCLDADEVVSAQLALSIAALFEGDGPAAAGYEVSRRTWYLGDWIRHTWYPDWKLRLVRATRRAGVASSCTSAWRSAVPQRGLRETCCTTPTETSRTTWRSR